LTVQGPFEQYVLADIYAWLEAHSGLSHSFANTAGTSHTSTNITSNSSYSSKMMIFVFGVICIKLDLTVSCLATKSQSSEATP
jgi:hypothetical protein